MSDTSQDGWIKIQYSTNSDSYYIPVYSGSDAIWNQKEETPEEIFDKKITKILKDGTEVELTYGELYDMRKMNKKPENLTKEEFEDMLIVIRI